MCTVTWIHQNGGYQIFCNRDEKRTRKPALPPRLAVSKGVRYLAPADGDYGGTWIATNEYGVSLCLLNGEPGTGLKSRGWLLPELASMRLAIDVRRFLMTAYLTAYAPFTVAALQAGSAASIIRWDGRGKLLQVDAARHAILTSSSYKTRQVLTRRREEFEHIARSPEGLTPERLAQFHRSHDPGASAWSTCMHRPDAETVSFTSIYVSATKTEFAYSPAAPCRQHASTTLTLDRAPATGSR